MSTRRKVIYGSPALLIAIIIVAGSLALTNPVQQSTSTQLVLQPPIDLGPTGESITPTGLPIVFDEDDEPDTDADGEGLRLTSKQRAVVNFEAEVGQEVEVTLKIDNLNDFSEILALVNIIAPDILLIDVIQDSGTDEVRLLGENQYVMEVSSGVGHSFIVRVTPLTSGIHSFIVEIRALG